jgi:hypothetical protein
MASASVIAIATGLVAGGGAVSRFAVGGGAAQAAVKIKAAISNKVFFMGCLLKLLVDLLGSIPKEKISQEEGFGKYRFSSDEPGGITEFTIHK